MIIAYFLPVYTTTIQLSQIGASEKEAINVWKEIQEKLTRQNACSMSLPFQK